MYRTFSPSVILTVIFTEIWTSYLQLESERNELRTGIFTGVLILGQDPGHD